MYPKTLKSKVGFSLLELSVGIAIAGVVVWLGSRFLSAQQKTTVQTGLKTQASTEIQNFFINRRKSFAKVQPGAITLSSTGPFSTLTIPRTSYDSSYNVITSDEVITVSCGDLPTDLAGVQLPPDFLCPGLCEAPQIPLKVSISINGNLGETYPTNNPVVFPTGETNSQIASSLCLTSNDNSIVFRMTYLLRQDTSTSIETVSKTEVFNLPLDNGIAKPQIFGGGR